MKTVTGTVRIGEDSDEQGAFASVEAFLKTLSAISSETGATIQAFDAAYVAGEDHLARAVELAERAMERGENVADSLSVEILLYAAGRRQIDRAMEMGVDVRTTEVVVLVIGEGAEAAETAVRDAIKPEPVAPDTDTLQEFFEITQSERAATDADLEAQVCERVALLEVRK